MAPIGPPDVDLLPALKLPTPDIQTDPLPVSDFPLDGIQTMRDAKGNVHASGERNLTSNDQTAPPLVDMRVIDIGNVMSMPYAGRLMANLAAKAIKIERKARPISTRTNPDSAVYPDNDPDEDPWNLTGTYNIMNRSKKLLTLDLSQPAGRDLLRGLIQVSDILTEDFTPRVMRGWGQDYPNASKPPPPAHHAVPQHDFTARSTSWQLCGGNRHRWRFPPNSTPP